MSGALALRGRRFLGTLLGAIGAAGIAADFPPGKRPLRRLLPRRTTYNVVCELGDPEAERTIVLIAEQGLGDTTVFPVYTQQMQGELVAGGSNSTLHTWDGITHGTVVTGAPAADGVAYIEKVLPAKKR